MRALQRRLDRHDITELLDARHYGETVEALAHRFGIHRTTVMAIIARARRSA